MQAYAKIAVSFVSVMQNTNWKTQTHKVTLCCPKIWSPRRQCPGTHLSIRAQPFTDLSQAVSPRFCIDSALFEALGIILLLWTGPCSVLLKKQQKKWRDKKTFSFPKQTFSIGQIQNFLIHSKNKEKIKKKVNKLHWNWYYPRLLYSPFLVHIYAKIPT